MTPERILVFALGLALTFFVISGIYAEAILPAFHTISAGLGK